MNFELTIAKTAEIEAEIEDILDTQFLRKRDQDFTLDLLKYTRVIYIQE